jgi:selenocysteine lyase/cysteine desulfurase
MPPYQGGGDMISSVSFAKTTYNKVPHKFEAGTPNIAGVIGSAPPWTTVADGPPRRARARADGARHRGLSAVPGVR